MRHRAVSMATVDGPLTATDSSAAGSDSAERAAGPATADGVSGDRTTAGESASPSSCRG